jgi:hypothetical protein
VTVDPDGLLGRPDGVGGEVGWAGPLDPEACRRLACDGAVTRVMVTRHPSGHHDRSDPLQEELAAPAPGRDGTPATQDLATLPTPATLPTLVTLPTPTMATIPAQAAGPPV